MPYNEDISLILINFYNKMPKKYYRLFTLGQWFSTFLTPWPFNTVPHVVETPNHKTSLVATS